MDSFFMKLSINHLILVKVSVMVKLEIASLIMFIILPLS